MTGNFFQILRKKLGLFYPHFSANNYLFALILIQCQLVYSFEPMQVNLINGSLEQKNQDIFFNQFTPNLIRYYSSFSEKNYGFGKGFGSNYHTQLFLLADQTIVILENGIGPWKVFLPQKQKSASQIKSKKNLEALKLGLVFFPILNQDQFDQNFSQVKNQSPLSNQFQCQKALKWIAVGNSFESIDCVATNFILKNNIGHETFFNFSGQLVKLKNPFFESTVFWEKERIKKIESTKGFDLSFKYLQNQNTISEAFAKNQKVEYGYSNDLLISVSYPTGEKEKFEYDLKTFEISKQIFVNDPKQFFLFRFNQSSQIEKVDQNRRTYIYKFLNQIEKIANENAELKTEIKINQNKKELTTTHGFKLKKIHPYFFQIYEKSNRSNLGKSETIYYFNDLSVFLPFEIKREKMVGKNSFDHLGRITKTKGLNGVIFEYHYQSQSLIDQINIGKRKIKYQYSELGNLNFIEEGNFKIIITQNEYFQKTKLLFEEINQKTKKTDYYLLEYHWKDQVHLERISLDGRNIIEFKTQKGELIPVESSDKKLVARYEGLISRYQQLKSMLLIN